MTRALCFRDGMWVFARDTELPLPLSVLHVATGGNFSECEAGCLCSYPEQHVGFTAHRAVTPSTPCVYSVVIHLCPRLIRAPWREPLWGLRVCVLGPGTVLGVEWAHRELLGEQLSEIPAELKFCLSTIVE